MKTLVVALSLLPFASAPAQVLGALETFTEEDNATSWARVDFADPGTARDALWQIPGSSNPEAYTTFNGNFEASLFADEISSNGAFVGDYDAVGIDTLRSDVFVQDLASFAELEFYLLAGDTFYYSDLFELTAPGWALVETSLSRDPWYFFDDEERVFVPTELTPLILSEVVEVGLTFYPNGPAADGKIVAIDNFALLPDLTLPDLTVTVLPQRARLSFNGIAGIQYTVQASNNLAPNGWTNLGEPFEGDGPFQTSLPRTRQRFFRVLTRPFFAEIP